MSKVKIYRAIPEMVNYPFYFKDIGRDGLTYYSKAIDKDTILTVGISEMEQFTVLYTEKFKYQSNTVYHLINEQEFTGALKKVLKRLDQLN